MFQNNTIKNLWAKTTAKVWQGQYWMVAFTPDSHEIASDIVSTALPEPHYHSIISDHHELAMLLHDTIWSQFRKQQQHREEYGPLAGISFDVPLDIEVSGFLAPMVAAMANNSISIVPQCALIYDHIFVNANDLPKAISVINQITQQALNE